jgi:type VI secretion system protein ImpK
MESMSVRLTDCFTEIFAYTLVFLERVGEKQYPYDKVRADFDRFFMLADMHRDKGGFNAEEYDLARYAVCAWVDEKILMSNWKDKNQWLKNQLQRLYYNTTSAGSDFFVKLNKINVTQKNVLEVYAICMCLGFKGRYFSDDAQDSYYLDELKLSTVMQIMGNSFKLTSAGDERLFPEAYDGGKLPLAPLKTVKRRALASALIVGVPIAIFFGLYFLFQYLLSAYVSDLM